MEDGSNRLRRRGEGSKKKEDGRWKMEATDKEKGGGE
jgi:hypothetical protein